MLRRTSTTTTVAAVTVALVLVVGATPAMGTGPDNGFTEPYSGTPSYTKWAPTQAPAAPLINRPLGQAQADQIARKLGLDKKRVFTEAQYEAFVSGRGVGGDPHWAALVDESVRIFTNTNGRPLISNVNGTPTASVLASYGLFVNRDGMLMSLANDAAPTKQVNPVLEPVVGYLATWCRANGCEDTLKMLYEDSAYPAELVFGIAAQNLGAPVQLVPNDLRGQKTTVGMSMAPSIWIVNFLLLYILKPEVAAQMPAWWTPIPEDVVAALEATEDGQVPYGEYASSFHR
jgi:hypothetical protein